MKSPMVHILALSLFLICSYAKRQLVGESLVTCMENSQITATFFDVTFNPDDKSIRYTFDFSTEVSDYVIADIDVYAYGFKIITKRVDVCDLGWKQFCPLYPGQVEVDSIQYISDEYVDQIPGIAYSVPDIDAFARVLLYTTDGTQVGCIQAFFSNEKTVSQTGAKWATAVIAGLGLLSSALASTIGSSNAASHISANAVSLFLYFQSVVVVSMQHVDSVPPIAASWAENLIWSMGLIRVEFMQKIFRWYVQATGGTPTLYLTSKTINILVQRSLEFGKELYKRGVQLLSKRAAPLVLYGNSNVLIFRGIKRLAYEAGIESTSIVATGFTFFIFFAYLLVGLVFAFKYGIEILSRSGVIKTPRFVEFRSNWKTILKGALSRYIFIGFTQLVILSFYEFYVHDSPAVVVLAVLFLLLAVGTLSWSAFRVVFFARKSIAEHKNPAAILYGDQRVLDKYGFFYTMFQAKFYWWGIVVLVHNFIKCILIGLGQGSGKAQAMVFWIVDMVYLGVLIHYKPYLNTPTNIISILIQLVTTINSFIFTFFSNIYGQAAAASSILGWVFFILNAAFSLILLILILVFSGYLLFSKNPDARFKPAKDDRTSFQRYSHHAAQKGPTAELLALGIAAKDHNANWETEIHNMRDMSKSSDVTNSLEESEEDKRIELNDDEKETFAGKIARKLTGGRKKSLNRSKSDKQSKGLLDDQSPQLQDQDDDFTFEPEDPFNFKSNHQKQDSVASFNHAVSNLNQNNVTTTNDFISGSSSTSKNAEITEEELYQRNKL